MRTGIFGAKICRRHKLSAGARAHALEPNLIAADTIRLAKGGEEKEGADEECNGAANSCQYWSAAAAGRQRRPQRGRVLECNLCARGAHLWNRATRACASSTTTMRSGGKSAALLLLLLALLPLGRFRESASLAAAADEVEENDRRIQAMQIGDDFAELRLNYLASPQPFGRLCVVSSAAATSATVAMSMMSCGRVLGGGPNCIRGQVGERRPRSSVTRTES